MDDNCYLSAWREKNPPAIELMKDPRFADCGIAALYAARFLQRPASAPPRLPGGLFLASRGPWMGQRILPFDQQIEVAHLCDELGLAKIADDARRWFPEATPLPGLFVSEKRYHSHVHTMTSSKSEVSDPESGIVRKGNCLATLYGEGTSLGYLRFGDVALQAFGPQLSPIGDCSQFGITGSGVHKPELTLDDSNFTLKGTVRLCGAQKWIDVEQHYRNEELHISMNPLEEPVPMLFYVYAPSCSFNGKILNHPSLEQIEGPADRVELGELVIKSRGAKARAIPLSGGNHFWGSTFLVAYEVGCFEWSVSSMR